MAHAVPYMHPTPRANAPAADLRSILQSIFDAYDVGVDKNGRRYLSGTTTSGEIDVHSSSRVHLGVIQDKCGKYLIYTPPTVHGAFMMALSQLNSLGRASRDNGISG